jgi:hypothetical protein
MGIYTHTHTRIHKLSNILRVTKKQNIDVHETNSGVTQEEDFLQTIIKPYDDLPRTSFYADLIKMIIKVNENIDDSNINFLFIMNANK